MTGAQPALAFEHLDSGNAAGIVDSVIAKLYVDTHSNVVDNPFYGVDRFTERVRGYLKSPKFEVVIARIEDEPVGLALGYGLPANARWWAGLTTPADPELVAEDGSRTFGFCELMVLPAWEGKGIGHALHDELLYKRPERRASLLVRADNDTARRAYFRWGWRQVGKLQPFPDSPHYDVLVLDLLAGAGTASATSGRERQKVIKPDRK